MEGYGRCIFLGVFSIADWMRVAMDDKEEDEADEADVADETEDDDDDIDPANDRASDPFIATP